MKILIPFPYLSPVFFFCFIWQSFVFNEPLDFNFSNIFPYFFFWIEFVSIDSFNVEGEMEENYEMESSSEAMTTELEEGEVLQNAELVCVDQEEMDRLAAEGKIEMEM